MGLPLKQQIAVGSYILKQKLAGNKKYPLVLMLEPLFQCNLECAGCGKIAYPDDILRKRMSVEDALSAVDECGAPIVSIPGGEPLIHKEMPELVKGLIKRRKYIFLCTNALLLESRLDDYEPSPYLTFSIHLDGNRERHDESVCREGVFDTVIKAMKKALDRGFRVTVNCTLFNGEEPAEVADFFDMATDLGVEGITVSPGYSYDLAPRDDVFLGRVDSKQLFRSIFEHGREDGRRKWSFNHSTMYLDFLAGNQAYQCTPWSTPTYNVFGWQKPCYLLVEEGYTETYAELLSDTDWDAYGYGRNSKCNNCMAHCGYEGTAVNTAFAKPFTALKVALQGPRTDGPMAKEADPVDPPPTPPTEIRIPADEIERRSNVG